jgi:outer membrane protein
MLSRVSLALMTLVVAGSSMVCAQEALTIDDAVQAALAHNAGLEASKASARIASAEADAARQTVWPRLSLAESWQRGDLPVFVFGSLLSSRRFGAENFAIDRLNHPLPANFFHATIGAEQTIYDGGRTGASATAAALRYDMAERGAEEAAATLVVAVTRAFGRIASAEASHRAAAVAATAADEDLGRARVRRDAGTVTDADVLSLAVHLAAMQQREIQAEGDAAIARAELNRLMGSPIDRPYEIVEPLPRSDLATVPLADLFRDAEQSRPELARANAAEQLANTQASLARAPLLPMATAQAGYELNGTQFGDRAGGWIVGAELRWTLSTGGTDRSRLRAAKEESTRARAAAEAVRAAIQVDVLTALRRWQSAQAREMVARAAVAQAEESQRIIRDRFEAGIAPVEDVVRASNARMDAETDRVAAVVDAVMAAAALRRAVGRNPYE